MPDDPALHVAVREERERQGRKLTEIATAAGVDVAHLGRFERGERDMTGEPLGRVLRALGLRVVPSSNCES